VVQKKLGMPEYAQERQTRHLGPLAAVVQTPVHSASSMPFSSSLQAQVFITMRQQFFQNHFHRNIKEILSLE